MGANPPKELVQKDVAAELRASIAARRELDPDMEEYLVGSFLARIEERVDARVEEQLAKHRAELNTTSQQAAAPKPHHDEGITVAIVAGSFALAIPLMVVAGIFLHGAGVIAVMVGLVLVNALYFATHSQR